MTRRLLVLLLGLLAAMTVASPAHAATSTVTLGQGGPSPSTVTVKAGDTVVFSNTDGTTHTLKSTSKNWSLPSTAVKAGGKVSHTFTGAGTFDYSDSYLFAGAVSQTAAGHVVVPAASPTPSATSKPSATSRPSASASARPSSAGPSASATALPTSSGVAIPPPITGGVVPTPEVTPTGGPAPQVAPGPGGSTAPAPSTTPVAAVGYADPSTIVQGSSRGFGLPVAIAVVAVVGVVTLLVRFLLATPEAGRPVR